MKGLDLVNSEFTEFDYERSVLTTVDFDYVLRHITEFEGITYEKNYIDYALENMQLVYRLGPRIFCSMDGTKEIVLVELEGKCPPVVHSATGEYNFIASSQCICVLLEGELFVIGRTNANISELDRSVITSNLLSVAEVEVRTDSIKVRMRRDGRVLTYVRYGGKTEYTMSQIYRNLILE